MNAEDETTRGHLALLTLDGALVREARSLFGPEGLRVVALRDLDRARDLLATRYLEVVLFDERIGADGFDILETLARHDLDAEPTFRVGLCQSTRASLDGLSKRCHCMLERNDLRQVLVEIQAFLEGQRPLVGPSAVETRQDIFLEATPEPPVVSGAGVDGAVEHEADRPPSPTSPVSAARRQSSLLQRSPDLASFLAELERRHTAMPNQSYFDLLDLPREASRDEVREVFDVASLRFHPDRNRGLPDPNACRKVAVLYAALCEAYDVLSHDDRRARYEQALSDGQLKLRTLGTTPARLTSLSDDPKARRFLMLAERAREDGDERGVRLNLKFAADLDPDNARLDAALREWQIPRDR